MTLDDTVLDQLAAQVRSAPPLPLVDVERLLATARRRPGGGEQQTLASHHMSVALDATLALVAAEDDVADLFQEAVTAVVAAVADYVAGAGDAAGLRPFVREAAEAQIGRVHDHDRQAREDGEAFVRDARLLDLAQVALGQRLGHPPTADELAETLHWTAARVEMVASILDDARRLDDESLIPFLDDVE